jgi:hypothetical protein
MDTVPEQRNLFHLELHERIKKADARARMVMKS